MNVRRSGWRITDDGDAIIEMAQASGLLLAGGADRNDPWVATTRGTGELIAAAVAEDARRIIVGLGGSATTDGGLGAFRALITDPCWNPHRPDRGRPELIVCCDVRTTFASAANVFGPQKGADRRMVADLRQRLLDLEGRYLTEYHVDVSMLPGAGAAGGLAGALAVLGARLVPGFDLIADTVGLDPALATADLVITGEGRLDHGSFDGKVVGGVIGRARDRGVPVVVVVGDQNTDELIDPAVTVLNLVQQFGETAAKTDTVGAITHVVRSHLSGVWKVGRQPSSWGPLRCAASHHARTRVP